jgi:hypothetical protein
LSGLGRLCAQFLSQGAAVVEGALAKIGKGRPALFGQGQDFGTAVLLGRVTGEQPLRVSRQIFRIAWEVMTPDGPYQAQADWLIVYDGARSPRRGMLGPEVEFQFWQVQRMLTECEYWVCCWLNNNAAR